MEGSGKSSERYETGLVSRDGTPYVLITNGWGPGFGSHSVSWVGFEIWEGPITNLQSLDFYVDVN